METKWYSDIWQLVVAPFKRGIPQIVEHGSCRKGFYATVALALVAFVFSNILPTFLSMIFVDKLSVALTGAAALSGAGILGLAVGLLLLSLPFLLLLGSNPDSIVGSIVWITIIIFATIAFAVYTFWVCLTLLSRQINKSRLATFGISIITSLIPVILLGILIGMVVLATSR